MGYKSMRACAQDLEKHGKLLRIRAELDPNLEMAEVHRRIFDAKGPAILFEKVKGSPFQAISNIYGTYEQTEWIFRKELEKVRKVVELKSDPALLLQNPLRYPSAPFTALTSLPKHQRFSIPVLHGQTTVDQLPQIKSWPMDGGAFVTLPQVLTLPPGSNKIMDSNIGMYRIQLSGNDYVSNKEIGMHYQIHRGIGVHHEAYNRSNDPFRASIFIGGPPSHAFSAIMPLPEGMSELTFAGMLGGRRFRYVRHKGHILSADADFVITGTIRKQDKKPEGPFGDHLGYYSLQHDFPVMDVDGVFHRKDPLWHFTVVGRPPQEDSSFGYLIHLIVELLTPQEFPGVKQINAVDEAGVHPLLLAVGSERYMPFRSTEKTLDEEKRKGPEEILTQATRILGSGQTSLAKFLIIAASNDNPNLDTHDYPGFFSHVLERIDWRRDLHFHTKTTMDTLDYSGGSWNAGSKVVMAAAGAPIRKLSNELPKQLQLPGEFREAQMVMPGVLAIEGPEVTDWVKGQAQMEAMATRLDPKLAESWPLIIVCDDARFLAQHISNFLWATFTRANPSHDIHGVAPFVEHKHWGCRGPLLIDARIKPHHAPVLVPDKTVSQRVDKLFSKGGELYGWNGKVTVAV